MAKKIVLFAKSANCMPCKFTKQFLEQSGVDFEIRYVDENPGHAETVKSLGFTSVPVTICANTTSLDDGTEAMLQEGIVKIAGFNRGELKKMIDGFVVSATV